MKHKEKVFVGMSGGVDSSVAALRLLQQGYDVTGVFIKVWHPDFLICNWEEERVDAMRVAAHLGIPFMTCDAEIAYRDQVAQYFIESYKAGITPNPDVMCNKAVKFGAFLDFAMYHGADFIATGHYVQRKQVDGKTVLCRGIDTNKDQSYFLWALDQTQLDKALFPIGDTVKEVIRQEARGATLPTATKKDSQGVCFLGHVDIPHFLSHYIDLVPGPVVNEAGTIIGEHDGAFVYTIGQRHGFIVRQHTDSVQPYYVHAKDILSNTLVVSHNPPVRQKKSSVTLHTIAIRTQLKTDAIYSAQFRYRQKPIPVKVESLHGTSLSLTLLDDTDDPSPGQSCVLYDNDICLGGGIIGA